MEIYFIIIFKNFNYKKYSCIVCMYCHGKCRLQKDEDG